MIHRLIITWLVISILGYGMAIAADVHYGETQTDQVVVQDDAGNLPDDLHVLPAHDQCGHGSFHLLGLSFAPTKPPACRAQSSKSAYLVVWVSILDTPPSRPPKA